MRIAAQDEVHLVGLGIQVIEQTLGVKHSAGARDGHKYSQEQLWFRYESRAQNRVSKQQGASGFRWQIVCYPWLAPFFRSDGETA